MIHWLCPICGEPLLPINHSLLCSNHHSFDRAKSGYVNLLLVQDKNSKIPGDNKEMVNARRDFLEEGYYAPLAEHFASAAASYLNGISCPAILDAGCGEGYYTSAMKKALEQSGCTPQIFAVDISKFAADKCARRCKDIECAAASVFKIPLADKSCDLVTSLFAPYAGEEFLRVLRPNGILLMVIPGKMHLWGLKEALYDQPYPNEVRDYELEGFDFLNTEKIKAEIHLTNPAHIRCLFQMTPYYYKSSREADRRLNALTELHTGISFEILAYRKI